MRVLKTGARILLATLQEIFDEASYRRFLERTGLPSSPEAYENFWREREDAQARRARCC
ncbi:MAG TPA: hypothetical protein VF123_08330 [Candidatus Sulfotelmatobacter sp.]